MNTAVLAIDIGASSGRHMLGKLENGKLTLEEIYRFPNGTVKKNGRLCWDFCPMTSFTGGRALPSSPSTRSIS